MSYSENYWRGQEQQQKPGFNSSTAVQRTMGKQGAFSPVSVFQRPNSRSRTPGPRSVSARGGNHVAPGLRGPSTGYGGRGGSHTERRMRSQPGAGSYQEQEQGYYPPNHPQAQRHYGGQQQRIGMPNNNTHHNYDQHNYSMDDGGSYDYDDGYGGDGNMMPIAEDARGRRFGEQPGPPPQRRGQSQPQQRPDNNSSGGRGGEGDDAMRAQLASITQLTHTIAQHLAIPHSQSQPPPQNDDYIDTPPTTTSAPTSQRSRAFVVPHPAQQSQQPLQVQQGAPGYPAPPGREVSPPQQQQQQQNNAASGGEGGGGGAAAELKKEEVERIVRRVEGHFVTKLDESKKVIDQQLQVIEALKKKRDEEKRHYTARIQTLERQLKLQLEDTDAAVVASTPNQIGGRSGDGSSVNTPKRGESDLAEVRRQLQWERRQRLVLEEQSHSLNENHAKLMETMEERLKQKDRLVGELAATAVAAGNNNTTSSSTRGVTPRSARLSGRLAPPTPTNDHLAASNNGSFSTPTPHNRVGGTTGGSAFKKGGPEVPPIRGLGGFTQRTVLQNAASMPPTASMQGAPRSSAHHGQQSAATGIFEMSPPDRDTSRDCSPDSRRSSSLSQQPRSRSRGDDSDDLEDGEDLTVEEVSMTGGSQAGRHTGGGSNHRSVSEGASTEVVRMSGGTSLSQKTTSHNNPYPHLPQKQHRQPSVAGSSGGFNERTADESAMEVMQLLSTIDAELDSISAM